MSLLKVKNTILSPLLMMILLAGSHNSIAKHCLRINADTSEYFNNVKDTLAISNHTATSMHVEAIANTPISLPVDSSAKTRTKEEEYMRAIAMRFKDKVVRDQYLAGRQNAIDYFDATYPNEQVAILTAVCFPAGLVVAAVSESRFPNEKRLLTNDYRQFQDLNFRRGYMVQARKMKSKYIWRGFASGVIVDLALLFSFIFL